MFFFSIFSENWGRGDINNFSNIDYSGLPLDFVSFTVNLKNKITKIL